MAKVISTHRTMQQQATAAPMQAGHTQAADNTCEFALPPDLDTQHAVAAAAAVVHLGLCAVPGLGSHLQHVPGLLNTAYLHVLCR